ncbi:uncharacterized protein [Solanum tuberosum]|uniref:uncharacterized protein n=1 Tax=Solanum tuberosum TaxID=4113 RepID=UPI00073A0447|nr:PREDICTED: uncharacterized protein LOC107058545 [Solanum tuberosum]
MLLKLGLGRTKSTTIMLQLADRFVARTDGIIEDVLVQVGTLIFLVDFVILDFEPDPEVPFILGCPILATGGALIDVAAGRLEIRAHDKVEVFDLYKAMKLLSLGTTSKPSIEEAPKLELKALPSHLRYAFLGVNESSPIILSSALSEVQVEASLKLLRKSKKAIG